MRRRSNLRSFRVGGFTLIELMIAVAIAALLASVAYGSYTSQIRKSRRTEAKTALLDMAAREERYYTTQNKYSATPSELGYTVSPDSSPMSVGTGLYKVTITITAGPPATFSLVAAPQGPQTNDTDCGSYTLTQTGAQTVSGTGTNCW